MMHTAVARDAGLIFVEFLVASLPHAHAGRCRAARSDALRTCGPVNKGLPCVRLNQPIVTYITTALPCCLDDRQRTVAQPIPSPHAPALDFANLISNPALPTTNGSDQSATLQSVPGCSCASDTLSRDRCSHTLPSVAPWFLPGQLGCSTRLASLLPLLRQQ